MVMVADAIVVPSASVISVSVSAMEIAGPPAGERRGVVRPTAVGVVGVEIQHRGIGVGGADGRHRDERLRYGAPGLPVEYADLDLLLGVEGRGRAELDLQDRGLVVGMRGRAGQGEGTGRGVVADATIPPGSAPAIASRSPAAAPLTWICASETSVPSGSLMSISESEIATGGPFAAMVVR